MRSSCEWLPYTVPDGRPAEELQVAAGTADDEGDAKSCGIPSVARIPPENAVTSVNIYVVEATTRTRHATKYPAGAIGGSLGSYRRSDVGSHREGVIL